MAPKYMKTIVCLANSRKITGRCVAGKEVGGQKGWVRPISAREHGELSEEERRYEDGKDPKLLDVIHVPLRSNKPHGCQTENHLIDEGYYWTRQGVLTAEELKPLLDKVDGPLWDNKSGSSSYGVLDRVVEDTANKLPDSLKLIAVDDLKVEVELEGGLFGPAKRKVRGRFTVNRIEYKLSITDPVVERKYLEGQNGTHIVGKATLCVSLGEPFNGYCYKLIAGVF